MGDQAHLYLPPRHLPSLQERCQRLGPHLGPVLFQFPPNFRTTSAKGKETVCNLQKLRELGEVRAPRRREPESGHRVSLGAEACKNASVRHVYTHTDAAAASRRCCRPAASLCLSSATPAGCAARCTTPCGSTTGAWPSRTSQAGGRGCALEVWQETPRCCAVREPPASMLPLCTPHACRWARQAEAGGGRLDRQPQPRAQPQAGALSDDLRLGRVRALSWLCRPGVEGATAGCCQRVGGAWARRACANRRAHTCQRCRPCCLPAVQYTGAHGAAEMKRWARWAKKWAAQGRCTYMAFNNDTIEEGGELPSAILDCRDAAAALRAAGVWT